MKHPPEFVTERAVREVVKRGRATAADLAAIRALHTAPDRSHDPAAITEWREELESILRKMNQPEAAAAAIEYANGSTMRVIGTIRGLTRARAHQLVTTAINRLRDTLR